MQREARETPSKKTKKNQSGNERKEQKQKTVIALFIWITKNGRFHLCVFSFPICIFL